MYRVTVAEAETRLRELVSAAVMGEDVFILEEDQKMLQLIPIRLKQKPEFGSAKGLIIMAEDFDSSLADFDEYMP
jgi:antitoxin (DNA-binding transcriptional repressor) of toxin-antitoxin stability system